MLREHRTCERADPDHRLDKIRSELKKDDTLKVVMQYVQYECPEDKQTEDSWPNNQVLEGTQKPPFPR